jgi:hypothetical protein
MLPKNLDTQIFKEIYQKFFEEQEEIEKNYIKKVMSIKAANKKVNQLKKCCSAEDYSYLDVHNLTRDSKLRRKSIGSRIESQIDCESSKFQNEISEINQKYILSKNSKSKASFENSDKFKSEKKIKINKKYFSTNPVNRRISKNPFVIRIKTLKTQSSNSQTLKNNLNHILKKKPKSNITLRKSQSKFRLSNRNSLLKKVSENKNFSQTCRKKHSNAHLLNTRKSNHNKLLTEPANCFDCSKKSSKSISKSINSKIDRKKSSRDSSFLIKAKNNFIRQDSGHKFIDEVDYVLSDNDNQIKKHADKTKFWLFEVDKNKDPFVKEKKYKLMNLKEKNQFFHNLSKKDFFSKILKFKKQRAKTIQKFGKEFEKLENEQSKSIF